MRVLKRTEGSARPAQRRWCKADVVLQELLQVARWERLELVCKDGNSNGLNKIPKTEFRGYDERPLGELDGLMTAGGCIGWSDSRPVGTPVAPFKWSAKSVALFFGSVSLMNSLAWVFL